MKVVIFKKKKKKKTYSLPLHQKNVHTLIPINVTTPIFL